MLCAELDPIVLDFFCAVLLLAIQILIPIVQLIVLLDPVKGEGRLKLKTGN